MANDIDLGVDEDDTEKLLEVVPEEMTNEELLELEQEEHRAKEEARGNCRRKRTPKNIHSKGLSRSSLKTLKTWTPNTERFSLIQNCSWCIICLQSNV